MNKKKQERERQLIRERILEAAEESYTQDQVRETSYKGQRLGWFDLNWLITNWFEEPNGVHDALQELVRDGHIIESSFWKGTFVEYRINPDNLEDDSE